MLVRHQLRGGYLMSLSESAWLGDGQRQRNSRKFPRIPEYHLHHTSHVTHHPEKNSYYVMSPLSTPVTLVTSRKSRSSLNSRLLVAKHLEPLLYEALHSSVSMVPTTYKPE